MKSASLLRMASDQRLAEHVAAGSDRAFEALYDRWQRPILAFCRHMLGSREEAEDALQHTFMAAYADLGRSGPPAAVRPWLFVIARNHCISVLRARRELPAAEVPERATNRLAADVDVREELRAVFAGLARLPDDQRAALVLTELGDVSHDEIARILDCRRDQVKSFVFQARSALAADRVARDTPCAEIRAQLAELRGGALRRNALRRHLDDCPGCRAFRDTLRTQRRQLRALLPVAPALGLKRTVLGAVLGGGGGGSAVGFGGLAATALIVVALPAGGVALARDDRPRAVAPASEVVALHDAGARAGEGARGPGGGADPRDRGHEPGAVGPAASAGDTGQDGAPRERGPARAGDDETGDTPSESRREADRGGADEEGAAERGGGAANGRADGDGAERGRGANHRTEGGGAQRGRGAEGAERGRGASGRTESPSTERRRAMRDRSEARSTERGGGTASGRTDSRGANGHTEGRGAEHGRGANGQAEGRGTATERAEGQGAATGRTDSTGAERDRGSATGREGQVTSEPGSAGRDEASERGARAPGGQTTAEPAHGGGAPETGASQLPASPANANRPQG